MNALGTLVTVEKEGYFEGSRRFFPVEGKLSRIKIQLLDKIFDQSFDATTGGNIAIGDGAGLSGGQDTIIAIGSNAHPGSPLRIGFSR